MSTPSITLVNNEEKKTKSSYSTLTLRKRGKYKSSLQIDEKYRITVKEADGLDCDAKKVSEVGKLKKV